MDKKLKIKELIFQCRNGSPKQRSAAIVDLQEMRASEALPVFLELLDYPGAGVRANVACALGELGNKKIGPSLLKLLEDSSPVVRINAAESLGLLCYTDGINSLINKLHSDKDPLVRLSVAEALGRLNDARVLPALVRALDDEDEGVRAYAADSIGSLGIVKAVPILIKKMDVEKSAFTKAFIFSALYRLGYKESLLSLVKLSETVDDVLAVTILNLAIELATPQNATSLKDMLHKVTQLRPSLLIEINSLIKRLNSIDGNKKP
ncbi:MAG: HEAT repeat domain-containing protein [Deltaproteobacteria bacterium]|nr:HEAT repeat domain-containing protein [Deltaproteobacteria bacterium]